MEVRGTDVLRRLIEVTWRTGLLYKRHLLLFSAG